MDKLTWVECDWTNYYSSGRPTENMAFRNIKLQVKFYLKFKGSGDLGGFFKKIIDMERKLMIDGIDNKNAVTRISNKYAISELRVKEILNYCTVWYYFKETYETKI